MQRVSVMSVAGDLIAVPIEGHGEAFSRFGSHSLSLCPALLFFIVLEKSFPLVVECLLSEDMSFTRVFVIFFET